MGQNRIPVPEQGLERSLGGDLDWTPPWAFGGTFFYRILAPQIALGLTPQRSEGNEQGTDQKNKLQSWSNLIHMPLALEAPFPP